MVKLAPSILAADPLNLERDVLRAEAAGCDWLHIDVMDAHFVPNLAYSPEVVRRLHETVNMPLDVHLMMDHPETLAVAFLNAGASTLTIHAEIEKDPAELLKEIRKHGAKAGIALRPGTSIDRIHNLLDKTDLVLVMTVEPGFGGQTLDEHVISKIRKLRDMGYPGLIEADGGIREDNLHLLVENGLNVAVMGTALFRAKKLEETVRRLRMI